VAVLVLVGALGAGCAGPLVEEAGGWRHRKQAWTIARPGGAGAPWQRVDVDGALLAFRRPDHELMSMQSRCGRPVASAEVMARHLLIGLRHREIVASTPVAVDGRSGWQQTFEIHGDPSGVRVETVTVVVGDCTLDWILAGRAEDTESEAAFEAWWQSFRLDPARWAEPAS
jgi:hypothetical protein